MPKAVSPCAASDWDAIWAEYDSRQPAPPPAPRGAAPPRAAPAPARPQRLLLLGLLGLVASYLAMPIAAAVSLAGAVQRLDVPALSEQVDWASLRQDLHEELVQDAERHGAMPPFIHAMAATMADRVASPQGLAAVLNERAGDGARPQLRDIVPEGLNRWRVTLASAEAGRGQASVTLAMGAGLRWNVIGLEISRR